jgi:hypothetical protein
VAAFRLTILVEAFLAKGAHHPFCSSIRHWRPGQQFR